LAAAIGVAVLSSTAQAQRAGGPATMVDLLLRHVAVEATRINGDSWDTLGGKPDLRVDVQCGVHRYKSPVKKDTFAHDFKAKAIRVRAGDVVEITIWDQDAITDDLIGRVTVAISAEDIAAGVANWSAFGRVRELRVELKR
jgi:hypothetical protein